MTQSTLVLNEPLSPPRIAGISAALAVHVAAFMLLMAPMTYAPSLPRTDDDISPPVEFIKPPVIKVPPAPPITTPMTVTTTTPVIHTPIDVAPQFLPPLIIDNGGANDIGYVGPSTNELGPSLPSGPISLSTEYAPAPRYPILSLRNGDEGTVLLLIEVAADGRPISGRIKKGSGFRELDQNALKHVLATWRFHPAMFQGLAVPALALVPVQYQINQ